jgi:cell division inhibitor SepF
MANVLKKAANFLGLVDDMDSTEDTVAMEQPRRTRSFSTVSSPVVETPSYVSVTPTLEVRESIIDRIITLHPRIYSDARTIGEHYRSGQPVIINLSDMEESERKRIIDFASGLVFGHHGSIEKVTSKVFLLTPPNVQVSSEEKSAAANASFFNQS